MGATPRSRAVHARYVAQISEHQVSRDTDCGGDASSGTLGIRALDCEFIADERLHCGLRSADFRTGVLQGGWPHSDGMDAAGLRRAVIVEKGRVVREREYTNTSGPTIQVVFEAGSLEAVHLSTSRLISRISTRCSCSGASTPTTSRRSSTTFRMRVSFASSRNGRVVDSDWRTSRLTTRRFAWTTQVAAASARCHQHLRAADRVSSARAQRSNAPGSRTGR